MAQIKVDKVSTAVYWSILQTKNLPHSKHLYEHKAEAVIENEKVEIFRDFNFNVDKLIKARRSEIIFIKKDLRNVIYKDIFKQK